MQYNKMSLTILFNSLDIAVQNLYFSGLFSSTVVILCLECILLLFIDITASSSLWNSLPIKLKSTFMKDTNGQFQIHFNLYFRYPSLNQFIQPQKITH